MNKPLLSIVVVVYDMRPQAMNTLYSLTADYQLGVSQQDYEVIVMENVSANNLDADAVAALGENFRYVLREESRPTPVYAANAGLALARGNFLGMMIDGARMLSPGVLRYSIDALRAYPQALVVTPGYHLGSEDQKFNVDTGHDETHEAALLESIAWPRQGYRLFEISCFSGANAHGYFHPLLESNCMIFPAQAIAVSGGLNEGFQTPGGGSVNLEFYSSIAEQEGVPLVILAGEGSFHQYHGGITTRQQEDLDAVLAAHRTELTEIRGRPYAGVRKEPIIFGSLSPQSLQYMEHSCKMGVKRARRFEHEQRPLWDFRGFDGMRQADEE